MVGWWGDHAGMMGDNGGAMGLVMMRWWGDCGVMWYDIAQSCFNPARCGTAWHDHGEMMGWSWWGDEVIMARRWGGHGPPWWPNHPAMATPPHNHDCKRRHVHPKWSSLELYKPIYLHFTRPTLVLNGGIMVIMMGCSWWDYGWWAWPWWGDITSPCPPHYPIMITPPSRHGCLIQYQRGPGEMYLKD